MTDIDKDLIALMEAEQYQETAELIEDLLKIEPINDDKRSLLARCYVYLGKAQQAIDQIQQLSTVNIDDHVTLMFSYHYLNMWEPMAIEARTLLEHNETAGVYYYLCLSEAKGRPDSELDLATREIIKMYLDKASSLDNSFPKIFTWLADLYDNENWIDKENILKRGIESFPSDESIRLDLAKIYRYRADSPKLTLNVLEPLLIGGNSPKAIWYAFDAYIILGQIHEARKLLSKIQIEQIEDYHYLAADLLLREGKYRQWIEYSEHHFNSGSPLDLIRKSLRRAFYNEKLGNLDDALDDFQSAIVNSMRHRVHDLQSYIYLWLEGELVEYATFNIVRDLCETILLTSSDTTVSEEYIGYVAYALHITTSIGETYDDLKPLLPFNEISFIDIVIKILGELPYLGYELFFHYSEDDFVKAIKCYVDWSLWAAENDLTFDPQVPKHNLTNWDNLISKFGIELHQIMYSRFLTATDNAIMEVILPFYEDFWRSILFQEQLFEQVKVINFRITEITNNQFGLFDLAYSLSEIGDTDLSKEKYQELIRLQPDMASGHNNLAVIYEQENNLYKALIHFDKAKELNPDEPIYKNNRARVSESIKGWETTKHEYDKYLNERRQKAAAFGLSTSQHDELMHKYWNTVTSNGRLAEEFGIKHIHTIIMPQISESTCPNCGSKLVFKNKTSKKTNRSMCIGCGHNMNTWCTCSFCEQTRTQLQKEEELKLQQRQQKAWQEIKEKYFNDGYVVWAIKRISRKEKGFLRAFIVTFRESENPAWEEICRQAEVVSEKRYVKHLKQLKLLLDRPNGRIIYNEALTLDHLEVPTVRNISKSRRFNVFQRDKHTCQYCGRKPPNVELEIDHLLPVAKGGTDEFENLVTSCVECNRGKSDKLIENFTGGYNQDRWREIIREKRFEALSQRRARIPEIEEAWLRSVGKKYLSKSDETAIHTFIETYDADWIIAAIQISGSKPIADYIPYTAGILRNWGTNGKPEYDININISLAEKPATEDQKIYIKSLLDGLNLTLEEVYPVKDFEKLTMLDATQLIGELTAKKD